MNKTNPTTAQSLLSGGSAIKVNNYQAVVYDNFAGIPLRATFLGGRWWVTTPGEKLVPLNKYFETNDIDFEFLSEAGGTVGARALAKMLGKGLECPSYSFEEDLHYKMRSLQRLGVTTDVTDEPLLLELDVFECPDESWRACCNIVDNYCDTLFDANRFSSKAVAEQWVYCYFDFIESLGMDITIV